MRILLIEDEKKIASFVKRGLKEENYAVDVAHNAEKGHFLVCDSGFAICCKCTCPAGQKQVFSLRLNVRDNLG